MSRNRRIPRTSAAKDTDVEVRVNVASGTAHSSSRVRPPNTADNLKLPHERDESVDAPSARPRAVMRQAEIDLASGKVDTDRRGDATTVFNKKRMSK